MISNEKPVDFVVGKKKRLATFDTFVAAVDEDQKRKLPKCLKLRFELLNQSRRDLTEVYAKSLEEFVSPALDEVKSVFQRTFDGKMAKNKSNFVPSLCLSLTETSNDFDSVLKLLEAKMFKLTPYFVRIDGRFVKSVSDAVRCLFYRIQCSTTPPNDVDFSMRNLVQLYKSKKSKKPIFVVVEDFQIFDVSVLNDFVHVLSANFAELAIFLVFPTVFGGPTLLNCVLSRQTMQTLDMSVVKTPPAVELLNKVFASLMENVWFKLNWKSAKYLNSTFANDFHSVQRYVDAVHLLLAKYFVEEPWSVFIGPISNFDRVIKQISSELKNCPVDNPSVQKSPRKQPKNTLNHVDDEYRHCIEKYAIDFACFLSFANCFQVLHSSTSMPKQNTRELYAVLLDPAYFTSERFNELKNFAESFDRTQLGTLIVECKGLIEKAPEESKKVGEESVTQFLDEYCKIFERIDEEQAKFDDERRRQSMECDDEEPQRRNGLSSSIKWHDYKRKLRTQIENKEEFDLFTKHKKAFLRRFFEFASKHSSKANVGRQTFLRIDEKDHILQRFCRPSVRDSYIKALTKPQVYVGQKRLGSSSTNNVHMSFDCCQIFDLLASMERTFKLRDLISIFKENVEASNVRRKNLKKQADKGDGETRLYKVIVEFEHVGLLKLQSRKFQTYSRLILYKV